jgi:DNA-binding transcriptional MerR regulator
MSGWRAPRFENQGGWPDEDPAAKGDAVTGAAAPHDPAVAPGTERRLSLREAARILEVPEARLRAIARAGLLAPQRGPIGPITFGFRDLLLLRTTKGLLESGVPLARIRRIWSSLREQLAADVPLTSVTIRTDGEDVIATDGVTAWRPDSGQSLLDFDAREIAERVEAVAAGRPVVEPASLPERPTGPRPRPTHVVRDAEAPGAPADASDAGQDLTAEQCYELGLELEGSSPLEALAAYQRAVELDPWMADAHVNLGRLYHLTGERGRAEAHYRDAVRLAPEDPVPHFDLGVLLEEQGRREEAVNAYQQAVNRDPDFADAECNLGLLLESMGRRQDAARHLMTARELYRTTE